MPRPRRFRRIWFEPGVTHFKPAGVPLSGRQVAILTFEELEAIRLGDLLELTQEQAAKKMNISQPTFYRLLSAARKKVADAVVNGKAIRIEGGHYKMAARPGVRGRFGAPTICVCPICGSRQEKTAGVPCAQMKCEKCGSLMTRGRA